MAIQNFVSGGYYGKLGQTIGQRWKNKRTVKAYAIPRNPRTEKQQANRKVFSGYTANALLGQQMNYKAPCWESEENTEWGLRMATASTLYKSGASEFNQIPLFPTSYTPAYSVEKVQPYGEPSDTQITFAVTGTLPTANRSLSVLVGFLNSESQSYDVELYTASFVYGEISTLTIKNTQPTRFDTTTKFLIISNDDAKNDNSTIYGAEQFLGEPIIIEKIFDTSLKQFITSLSTVAVGANYRGDFTIVFAQRYSQGANAISGVSIYSVSAGVWESLDLENVSFVNVDGYFGISFSISRSRPDLINAFPANAYIKIASISSETAYAKYSASDIQLSLTETAPIVREFRIEDATHSTTAGDEYYIFPLAYSGNTQIFNTVPKSKNWDLQGGRTSSENAIWALQASMSQKFVLTGENALLKYYEPAQFTFKKDYEINGVTYSLNTPPTVGTLYISNSIFYDSASAADWAQPEGGVLEKDIDVSSSVLDAMGVPNVSTFLDLLKNMSKNIPTSSVRLWGSAETESGETVNFENEAPTKIELSMYYGSRSPFIEIDLIFSSNKYASYTDFTRVETESGKDLEITLTPTTAQKQTYPNLCSVVIRARV